jgi:hypothetical protein
MMAYHKYTTNHVNTWGLSLRLIWISIKELMMQTYNKIYNSYRFYIFYFLIIAKQVLTIEKHHQINL